MALQYDLTSSIGVQSYLQTHDYPSCVSAERLAEGWSGFVYRARIDGHTNQPSTIIIKHVEGYAARLPNFSIGQGRMDYEAKGLNFLGLLSTNAEIRDIRIPQLLKYDDENHVLIMEDAGDLPSLKSWLQSDSPSHQIVSVGEKLGSYLAHIHNTTAENSVLKKAFSSNVIAKNLSSSVYFAALPAAAKKYGYTQPFITAAAEFAANEVLTAEQVWTLGDFWTGNVLVAALDGRVEPELTNVDLELAKPGTAAFDIGQMGAEMLCLARFRHQEQGSLLLQSFFRSYKANSKVTIDAAAVAIRIGAHLFTIMPRAWSAEKGEDRVKEVLEEGFELLEMGWENNNLALKRSIVGTFMD